MNSLLHPLRPILSLHQTRASTSPPAHDSLAATGGKHDDALPRIRASTTSEKKPKRQQDDYHSTLKALNSKGRFPRKSLGQDPYMASLVRERFNGSERVKVLEDDFTRSHIRSHMSSFLSAKSPEDGNVSTAKVVANIPFNISTDVVKQLLPMGDIFSEVVLLLQDEAAQRLVDFSLKSSEHRPINIFVNFYSDPEYKLKVLRSNFFPQPNVDAAIVAFKLKQTADYPHVSSLKSFFSTVNSAFNGKRKMLRKSLQHICPSPDIEAALSAINLPPTSRPEELTLEDFVKLHNMIVKL